MTSEQLSKFCALSLGIFLLWGISGCAFQQPISSAEQVVYSKKDILAELAKANVVYLGETHTSVADHQAQLAIITALYQQNPQIAIALEMFQRPFQPVLERYLAGEIDETQLRQQTEYDLRWGFDWEYYAPILRFARAHQIPLIAANTPSEITRQVASDGLDSLDEDDFRYIPPLTEIETDDPDYRQMLRATYEHHAHGGHDNSDSFENFFAAQVLWDETMAEAIAQFYQANPDYQIIVLAGQGHIIYGYGIPNRVARRINQNSFRQLSVLFGETQTFEKSEPPADYFWQHQ
ncbi:ChaN family lipoprotein [Pleurocapsales cyanobacterium LEGE 06147]|nr:ChaN family lipoprotein [Pleurocapsales cyanobacterium LEGE 06147]